VSQYTHEQRAALHIARAEKAQARADAAKLRDRMKIAAVYDKAQRMLTSALDQMENADFQDALAVRDRLRVLYQEALNATK
jgi:protein-arginine kinase activator protein McsA